MKLVAILRIKDEMPVIMECLAKLSELVDEILVLDNGSTDGTLEAYTLFPKITAVLKTEGYHEGRDKCLLLTKAKERNPDWLLWIDGDEVFEKALTRKDIDRYMYSGYDSIRFRMCTFWLSRDRFRINGKMFLYTLQPQRSMWRNTPHAYFSAKKMHAGDIRGIQGRGYTSPFRIKHYGYPTPEKIERKYSRYEVEDHDGIRTYEHIRPDAPARLMKFREYENPFANYAYILAYKYIANILLLFIRIIIKCKKILYGNV